MKQQQPLLSCPPLLLGWGNSMGEQKVWLRSFPTPNCCILKGGAGWWHVVLWDRRTRRCQYQTSSAASWGLYPETAKYIFPSIWFHHTSREISSCPLCFGWMAFSSFPRGRQHSPVSSGREEWHSPLLLPGSLPRSLPDKKQGAGKHQPDFLFQCPSWWCRYDVLDSSLKGIIFEYQL